MQRVSFEGNVRATSKTSEERGVHALHLSPRERGLQRGLRLLGCHGIWENVTFWGERLKLGASWPEFSTSVTLAGREGVLPWGKLCFPGDQL